MPQMSCLQIFTLMHGNWESYGIGELLTKLCHILEISRIHYFVVLMNEIYTADDTEHVCLD